MTFYKEKNGCIVLSVRVVPRAAKDEIAGTLGNALKVRIQAPPVEGKANAYLVKFLAKKWNLARSDIELLSGETDRNKRLKISNPSTELRKELLSIGAG